MRSIARSAVENNRIAVAFVNGSRGKVAKQEYDRLRGLLEQSKDARIAARVALEKHQESMDAEALSKSRSGVTRKRYLGLPLRTLFFADHTGGVPATCEMTADV